MIHISDQAVIDLAKKVLIDKYVDAAEPLWDLDDDGNPIYVDIGCANWVSCELFELQAEPNPKVDRSDEGIDVTIQALVKWEHWRYTLLREFYLPLYFQDGEWSVSTDYDWADIDFYDNSDLEDEL